MVSVPEEAERIAEELEVALLRANLSDINFKKYQLAQMVAEKIQNVKNSEMYKKEHVKLDFENLLEEFNIEKEIAKAKA